MYPVDDLAAIINEIWSAKAAGVDVDMIRSNKVWIGAIDQVIRLLDEGTVRVAQKSGDTWHVNQWCKCAILLAFYVYNNKLNNDLNGELGFSHHCYDKIPNKFGNWNEDKFSKAMIRVLPGAVVRYGSFVGTRTILMPAFVNIGAYIDSGTMIDTWSTVGSCAQVGKRCHISGGVGLGGVLEPLQNNPVIIEDDCFIGARSEIAEGVIVKEGSVIAMGVFISASSKIIDRNTGAIYYGTVPPFSVVVPGARSVKEDGLSLYSPVIVKTVDAKTRAKVSINDLLRGVLS